MVVKPEIVAKNLLIATVLVMRTVEANIQLMAISITVVELVVVEVVVESIHYANVTSRNIYVAEKI